MASLAPCEPRGTLTIRGYGPVEPREARDRRRQQRAVARVTALDDYDLADEQRRGIAPGSEWARGVDADEAAIAKLTASNAAMDNARDATQVFGGYGFMNEFPVARHYRDSKVLEIGEGTTEVQLMLIARELGM